MENEAEQTKQWEAHQKARAIATLKSRMDDLKRAVEKLNADTLMPAEDSWWVAGRTSIIAKDVKAIRSIAAEFNDLVAKIGFTKI